jgi:hypothetical protein
MPVPVDIVPVDIVPVDIVPVDIVPVDIVPVDIVPVDIVPVDIVPVGLVAVLSEAPPAPPSPSSTDRPQPVAASAQAATTKPVAPRTRPAFREEAAYMGRSYTTPRRPRDLTSCSWSS